MTGLSLRSFSSRIAAEFAAHQREDRHAASSVDIGKLFEAAWTTSSPATYDHSVSLVESRLRRSGLDEAFFAGKRCFDGGCGIGRLSIAAAKMGAREVIAADIGKRPWTLYLYGDGGLYWPIYDRMRAVVSRFPVADVKRSLLRLNLREGLIYTYLDNVLTPRTYHRGGGIIAMLKEIDPGLTWRRARASPTDDVDICLATRYGQRITGPEGEVRLVITPSARSLR